jgi:hypothetical protein
MSADQIHDHRDRPKDDGDPQSAAAALPSDAAVECANEDPSDEEVDGENAKDQRREHVAELREYMMMHGLA